MDRHALAQEALKLPPSERVEIIDALWRSLDPVDQQQVDDAWLRESHDRLAAYRAGTVRGIEGEKALSSIEDELRR